MGAKSEVKNNRRIYTAGAPGALSVQAESVQGSCDPETVERVEGDVVGLELIYADIEKGLKEYSVLIGVDDLSTISQGRWNGCLIYIYNKYIKSMRYIYTINNNRIPDEYNTDVLLILCDYYIGLCHLYDKQISIMGFSYLTGVDNGIIELWGKNKLKKSSITSKQIYKKLLEHNEESLQDKLVTGKQNPVGVVAVLNNCFGWSTSRVTHEAAASTADNGSIAAQMGLTIEEKS